MRLEWISTWGPSSGKEELCEVLVLAAEGGVLLGMALLAGSRVTLDVEDDGAVTIEALAKIRSIH